MGASSQPASHASQGGKRERAIHGWMMVGCLDGWLDGWMRFRPYLAHRFVTYASPRAGANQTFSLPPLMSSAQNFECFLSPRLKETNMLGDFLALSALSTQDVANCTHPRHSAFHGVMFNFSASFSPPTPLSTSSGVQANERAPAPAARKPQLVITTAAPRIPRRSRPQTHSYLCPCSCSHTV